MKKIRLLVVGMVFFTHANAQSSSFIVSKDISYQARWEPNICNHAEPEATQDAQLQCLREGFNGAILFREIKRQCESRYSHLFEHFTGVYHCR